MFRFLIIAFTILMIACNSTKKITGKNRLAVDSTVTVFTKSTEVKGKDSIGEFITATTSQTNIDSCYTKVTKVNEVFGKDSVTGKRVLKYRETTITEAGNIKSKKTQTNAVAQKAANSELAASNKNIITTTSVKRNEAAIKKDMTRKTMSWQLYFVVVAVIVCSVIYLIRKFI